jgi:hypothetical protein
MEIDPATGKQAHTDEDCDSYGRYIFRAYKDYLVCRELAARWGLDPSACDPVNPLSRGPDNYLPPEYGSMHAAKDASRKMRSATAAAAGLRTARPTREGGRALRSRDRE